MTLPEQSGSPVVVASAFDFSDVAFLTVAEVAAVLRLSKMTVYRMVHSGELPATRIGRGFRVRAEVLREYLASGAMEVV